MRRVIAAVVMLGAARGLILVMLERAKLTTHTPYGTGQLFGAVFLVLVLLLAIREVLRA
jgi:hypothetical protein